MKFQPRDYQKRAIKALVQNQHFGLFLRPGLGKTSSVLAAFKLMRAKGFAAKMLVVAPRRVCQLVWPREAMKWEDFRGLRVHFLHGDGRDASAIHENDVLCINPEGLPWLFDAVGARNWPFDWLVVDESTKFKHTNSKRFKLLKSRLPLFLRRTILTGTPAPNGLLDLFGQVYVMDCGKSLGRFVTHFRNEYFYPSGYGGYSWLPQDDAEERIMRRLAPSTLTMVAEDWLDMPELLDGPEYDIEVELPRKVMLKYREMERELLVELERCRTIAAANNGVAALKCRQIANGGVYSGDGKDRETVELHDAKVEALEDLVEQLQGSPLLVVYEFDHDRERIQKRLGAENAPAFSGGLSDAEAARLEASWNAGDLPVLLAQPQSVAHGLNLQEGSGHNIVWFGMLWDLELYDQLRNRLWRSGQQSERVFVRHIVARGTVDEHVLAGVRGKDRRQSSLMASLKSGLHGGYAGAPRDRKK